VSLPTSLNAGRAHARYCDSTLIAAVACQKQIQEAAQFSEWTSYESSGVGCTFKAAPGPAKLAELYNVLFIIAAVAQSKEYIGINKELD